MRRLEGDIDRALAYEHATLRLAGTVGENRTLLAQLVQAAIAGIAFDSMQHVLDWNGAVVGDAASIVHETRALRDPENFVRALTGEVLYTRDHLHRVSPRLCAGLNELRMIDALTAMADAVKTEDPNRRRALLAQAQDTAERGPYLLYAIAQITVPAHVRSVEAWDRVVAQTTLMEVGLALSQYHAEHGEYPEALEAAAAYLDGAVPGDPRTGAPLAYERRGEGYVLYSVGPNLTDDGGIPLGGPGGKSGDILWSIGQPEPEPQESSDSTPVRSRRSQQQFEKLRGRG